MLEVVNLKKIYSIKGGAKTRALDGVSLSFPKTGMVFLLGKSGSGKSTLLNVCGGLDTPTEGEILVKGRSSKEFSQSDFDSYRNAYIGFIFQEYNLLDEFTVAENISLALELQGKPKDEERVAEILKQVEMEEYAARKPNTLSGGQRQRVAIARALVKNPEIIMADEPSGALDSATGEQVFDTLKALSKTKLVLVVSHDREFAERYADRIVELKDGKVLTDLTKTEKKGFVATMPPSNEEEKTEKPIFIRSRLPVKRAVRMGVASLKSKPVRLVFTLLLCLLSFAMFGLFSTLMLYDKETTVRKSLQDSNATHIMLKKEYEIIQHSYSLSSNSWRETKESRNHRITQTELESYKALYGDGVFGIVSGYGYAQNLGGDPRGIPPLEEASIGGWAILPKDTSAIKLMAGAYPAAHNELLVSQYFARGVMVRGFSDGQETPKTEGELVGKKVQVADEYYVVSGVFESDYDRLVREYPALVSGANPTLEEYNSQSTWVSGDLNETLSSVAFLAPTREAQLLEIGGENVFTVSNSLLSPMKNDSLLLGLGGEAYFRYVNAARIPKQAECVGKRETEAGEALVGSDILIDLSNRANVAEREALLAELFEEFKLRYEQFLAQTGYSSKYGEEDIPSLLLDPELGQIYYDYVQLWKLLNGQIPEQWVQEGYEREEPLFQNIFLPLWTENGENSYQARYKKISPLNDRIIEIDGEKRTFAQWADALEEGAFTEREEGKWTVVAKLDLAQQKRVAQALLAELDGCVFSGQVAYRTEAGFGGFMQTTGAVRSYSVVGIVLDSDLFFVEDGTYEEMKADNISLPRNRGFSERWVETAFEETETALYSLAYLPYDHSKTQTEGLKAFTFEYEQGSRITPCNPLVRHVENASKTVEKLSTIFLLVGVVMAVFSSLLLSNFISVSIASKRKDIGILRALGARGADVFKIFFAESILIAASCVCLGTIASVVGCALLNGAVGSALAGVSLFVLGPLSIVIMLAVAALTTVIATFLPVYFAARKKPADSIRAL